MKAFAPLVFAAFLLAACGTATTKPAGPVTAAEADAFVAKAEKELADLSEFTSHTDWVRSTYIMYDTNWLSAKANEQYTLRSVALAKEAARFNGVKGLSPDTARKLLFLKLALTLPAPDREGAAAELAKISTDLDEKYSAGKFTLSGKAMRLDDAEDEMAHSRDPARLKAVWEGWHSVAPPMKEEYVRLVDIANEGSKELGFADTGALWRSNYDMAPDEFAKTTDRLWEQVKPLYVQLHCYVRGRLNAKYGAAVQPATGAIRADLLGNMWAQDWSNVYPLVAPKSSGLGYDLTVRLKAKKYDELKMIKTGEGFFTSLGFEPLPTTFWERSMIVRPRDREVVCHASAWDVDYVDDRKSSLVSVLEQRDSGKLGLAERRAVKAFEESSFPALKKQIEEAAGFAPPLEVRWTHLATKDSADSYVDAWPKVYFKPLIEALKRVGRDAMGKEALKSGLKSIIIQNSSGNYSSERWATFRDGTLVLDHDPLSNQDYWEERKNRLVYILEKGL